MGAGAAVPLPGGRDAPYLGVGLEPVQQLVVHHRPDPGDLLVLPFVGQLARAVEDFAVALQALPHLVQLVVLACAAGEHGRVPRGVLAGRVQQA